MRIPSICSADDVEPLDNQRAIANPNTSAMQIRAIARELPTVGLEDALAIVLALLEREPASFSRTGACRGPRLVLERRLDLVDAQLVLASLATLEGHMAAAGAEALAELAQRSGLRRVQLLLEDWLEARPGGQ
jgi:hypothetical protein